ncbi:hypothetical protein W97_03224 [Coniosporium apollinis CBS 100218]|uniref:F-box domain-containing protein n=1 Tax=Coniosporium apollinis (strain CBS 100218) TaxID=1168221 RepID=R7YQ97_CONA1|nr:uncharacterized protein W97_03224 [Coniosporium apollinis CBS 100218]EON63994.1 hypothetical protein W97_03224 [Coniosporium apollinis CBS 100218]
MHPSSRGQKDLPLNLLALIIAQIDDVADLSRLTRTSRLLYYMTLPRLYEHVTLRSYAELRYFNGRPEGYGGGSPFSMGLNGLATRNTASYVKGWKLLGDWRESDVDDFTKGRVPDNSMMLNIVIRAAMDKMTCLESFGWELNTKPLSTIYHGLANRHTLTSLTLAFPSTRVPRPTVLIPPMPNLRAFKALNIDPLCYPDDISLLLLHSRNLESLTLNWSPRMRDEGETSVNLHSYFGKCIAAGHILPVQHFSFSNLFSQHDVDMEQVFRFETMRSVTFINCVGGEDPMTVFLDNSWRMKEPGVIPTQLKMMRGDILDRTHAGMLSRFNGLEELYLVNAKRQRHNSTSASTTPMRTPAAASPITRSPSTKEASQESIQVAADYLAAITSHHGHSMRRLLLSDQWRLGQDVVSRLVAACPNLEQLGLALEGRWPGELRAFIPLMPKLYAVRILIGLEDNEVEHFAALDDSVHEALLGHELWRPEYKNLQYIGLGDFVFECGKIIHSDSKATEKGSKPVLLRQVKRVPKEEAKKIEIWGMDSLDV